MDLTCSIKESSKKRKWKESHPLAWGVEYDINWRCINKSVNPIRGQQRFPVPVFSIPIPVLRLSSLGTRFRFRFRDCPWLEHDSKSGSETAQAWNSIPRLHRHARQKSRCINDPCFFCLFWFWSSIAFVLLAWVLKGEKMQSKQSALYTTKHFFVLPLLFFTLQCCIYSCANSRLLVNCVKELGPFCQ